eukprot:465716-Alexandrium_andersonii.AAC.1
MDHALFGMHPLVFGPAKALPLMSCRRLSHFPTHYAGPFTWAPRIMHCTSSSTETPGGRGS